MAVVDPAAEQVLHQEPAGRQQLDLLGEGAGLPGVPEARRHVHEAGPAAADLRDRPLDRDHPAHDRPGQLHVAVVAGQPGRPDALLATVHGRDLGLVHRRPEAEPAPVAVGESGRVLVQPVHHPVGPVPDEPPGRRVQAVPGEPGPDRAGAGVYGQ
ncbi:MAG TPA: hypothetical protein VG411_09730, partial [Actinomycetota bacterium]|nr:hypothetical protein [Actinomycetota bacterium]